MYQIIFIGTRFEIIGNSLRKMLSKEANKKEGGIIFHQNIWRLHRVQTIP